MAVMYLARQLGGPESDNLDSNTSTSTHSYYAGNTNGTNIRNRNISRLLVVIERARSHMKPAQMERGQIHAEIAIHAHIRESTRFCFGNTLQLVITRAKLSPFYEVGKMR